MKALFLILPLAFTVQAQDFNQCKDSSDKATVYFYRVKESNALRKGETGVTLDGTRLFQMPKATYVGFQILPGKYELTMGHKETDYLLNAEPGKRYFFRVSNTVAGFRALQILSLISEDQAVYQMKLLKPLSPDNLKDRKLERCESVTSLSEGP